jgi:hypothetical protein
MSMVQLVVAVFLAVLLTALAAVAVWCMRVVWKLFWSQFRG